MIYCYKAEDGHSVTQRPFPMGEAPASFTSKGVKYWRDLAAEHCVGKSKRCDLWPMVSDFGGVHPDQIPEAIAIAKKRGVEVSYTKDGSVIWNSKSHRKAHCEAVGKFDLDGGYGDPQQRN